MWFHFGRVIGEYPHLDKISFKDTSIIKIDKIENLLKPIIILLIRFQVMEFEFLKQMKQKILLKPEVKIFLLCCSLESI